VVKEQRIVLAAKIANAVAGIEVTGLCYRERETRRHVAEPVFPAEPIHHDTDLRMEWLFVTNDAATFVAIARRSTRQSLTTTGPPWTIVPLPLLTHHRI